MTTKERVDSAVIRRVFELYRMDDGDIASLYQKIEQHLTVTYKQVIQRQLTLYGCQKLATGPDSAAQKWIAAKARSDSESIARTYDRELMNRIQSIYRQNKRSNRYAYIRTLDAWIVQRNSYKIPSISLNTLTAAREYAQTRFVEENNIRGKWRLVGPPPVCKVCMRIAALGAVDWAVTQKPRNKLPSHVNCPHQWAQLIPKKIECGPDTWTG